MKAKRKIQRLEILMLDQDKRIKRLERTMTNLAVAGSAGKITPIKRNREIPGIEISEAELRDFGPHTHGMGEIEGHDVIGDPEPAPDLYTCKYNRDYIHTHPCTCLGQTALDLLPQES